MRKNIKSNCRRAAICLLLCLCMTLASLSFTSCDKESGGASDGGLVEVIRVIDDINVGGKITNDRIATVKVSALSVPEGALSDIPKSKYAAVKLYPGDYITEEKLTDVKPATDEDEKPEIDSVDPESLGYIVITSYADHAQGGDYTDAIAKAIEENPGRTIYFPDGNYIIRKPIDIPADPEKSVSLRLSNNTVIKAFDWEDPKTAMIRIGAGSDTQGEISVDEHINTRSSCYVIGGCLNAGAIASGISVEDGRDALIYNVSIKNAFYGIHIKEGKNSRGASFVNVDNVNVTGFEAPDSIGVLVEGKYNNVSNMRIASVQYGVKCTETGSNNIFRNLHPLGVSMNASTTTAGFWDMSDGNVFDICYSDQFATGFLVEENTRSVFTGCFCYWWTAAGGYHVGFRSNGKFNSIVTNCKVSHSHADLQTDAYLLVGEDGGEGVVLYPANNIVNHENDYILEQYCPTGQL